MGVVKTKCWDCGKPIERYASQEKPRNRQWCDECEKRIRKETKERNEVQRQLRKIKSMEVALGILESQNYNMYRCKPEIEAVKEYYFSGKAKYGSSLEIAAAIELLINRIKVRTQVQIRGYRADMVLPDLKVVLEIDGDRHSRGNYKDAMRDILVHEEMGKEWETVRVKSNRIRLELRNLVPYILDQHSKQQELREKHDGDIPWTYNHNEYTEIYRLAKKLKPLPKTNNPI